MPRSFGAFEEEPSWYDVAQICMNWHVANSATQRYPDQNKNFCDKCGDPTITACPACNRPVRGKYHAPGVIVIGDDPAPAHCIECGKPYPWTERRLAAAKKLAQEMEGLTVEQRGLLARSLDDLVRDTPQTPVAATRFKQPMAKVGSAAAKGLRDIVVDIASETAKKTLGM